MTGPRPQQRQRRMRNQDHRCPPASRYLQPDYFVQPENKEAPQQECAACEDPQTMEAESTLTFS